MNLNRTQIQSDSFLPSVIDSQHEHSRIIPSYIKSQLQCQLCAYQYDLYQKVPMMLCDNQHHCCLGCVNEIIVRKKQCQFCRRKIQTNKIFKNRMVCKILEQAAKKQGIKPKINQNPQKMIKNSGNSSIIIDNNNAYSHLFQHGAFNNNDIINSNNQIQVNPLLNQPLLNNYNQPDTRSCLRKVSQGIQCDNSLFCVTYVITYFIIIPFFICQMIYGFDIQRQDCLDKDYGIGMTLRQWLISSGLIGLSMFSIQFFGMLTKIIFKKKKLLQVISIMNLIFFVLKFLGYNVVGLVLISNVAEDDLATCNNSLQAYMEAILIIFIISFSCLCALGDRR